MVKGTVVAALALATAMTAAAPAGAASSASLCDPLARATNTCGPSTSIAGRGGDVREPVLSQVHQDLPASAKGKAPKRFKATIPVYFHVITDGSIGALTNKQIATQIAILNNTFAGREGGSDTGFSFTLAGVTRTDNAGWFYSNPGGTDEHTMKRTLRSGGDDALNLYSTTAGDFLGWAYLPDITSKPGQESRHGVVSDWESITGTSTTYAGGPLRPGRDRHARGRPLAQPRAHVLRRLQRQGRLRRRHAGREDAHQRLPGRQGHVSRAGAGPDPQLHGLLLRQLLHGVHGRPHASHARRMAAVQGAVAVD